MQTAEHAEIAEKLLLGVFDVLCDQV